VTSQAEDNAAEQLAQLDLELSEERAQTFTVLHQVDKVQRAEDGEFESALRAIGETTVESVPGAQYAGITVVEGSTLITTMGATHRYPALLDDVQREYRQGPCLSAAWNHQIIHIDDLSTDDRWPKYRAAALDRTPVRSMVSFRLFGDDKLSAALNLYASSAGAFDDDSVELGLVYAAHTSVAWNSMRREQQFRSALASRDVIGQAKGMLMERFNIDAVAAFELLRRLSQESNTRLVDIAEQLVATRPA
jgi:ANTAR domain/GAF domain